MRSGWLVAAAAAACLAAAAAQEAFGVQQVWFARKDGGYAVRADLQVGQPDLVDKIARGGYPAEFVFELNFYQRRSWLPDPQVGDISWRGRLTYDALTRRYLLTGGDGRRQQFATLAAALEKVSRLRAGASRDSGYVKIISRDDVYIRARFYLATGSLPEPLQVGLLVQGGTGGDWTTLPVERRPAQ